MKQFLLRFMALAKRVCAPADRPLAVELLIYSGRPNPTFVIIDGKTVREILAMANNLPVDKASAGGAAALPPSRLGYQGFRVHTEAATLPHRDAFLVFHATVQLVAVAGSKPACAHRIDARVALEGKLVALAKSARIVDDSLLALITSCE
jgi:hypothetical protein